MHEFSTISACSRSATPVSQSIILSAVLWRISTADCGRHEHYALVITCVLTCMLWYFKVLFLAYIDGAEHQLVLSTYQNADGDSV